MLITRILACGGLFQTVASQVNSPQITQDFSKNGVPAKWAPGHPTTFGKEDFSYTLGVPHPLHPFDATITRDEKYLVSSNGTAIVFSDLEKNATTATISLELGGRTLGSIGGLTVVPAAQGGYHVVFRLYDSWAPPFNKEWTVRQRVNSDLQPVGVAGFLDGRIGAVSEKGRLALHADAKSSIEVYDLNGQATDKPIASLPSLSSPSLDFGPDGEQLLSGKFTDPALVELWNSNSGEKMLTFPPYPPNSYFHSAIFSPDGRSVAIASTTMGTAQGTISRVQIRAVADPDAAPLEGLNFEWSYGMAWSPSGRQIALLGRDRLQVFDVPSMERVQMWQVAEVVDGMSLSHVVWLDGGKKISWMSSPASRHMYDFEANTESLWTASLSNRLWGDSEGSRIYYLEKKGYVVSVDGDSRVRFWKI